MKNPATAFSNIQSNIKQYIKSAFNTSSTSFEEERAALLDKEGVLFKSRT